MQCKRAFGKSGADQPWPDGLIWSGRDAMKRKSLFGADGARWRHASVVLALGIGTAPAAHAYSAEITMHCAGVTDFLNQGTHGTSCGFDDFRHSFTTDPNVPIAEYDQDDLERGPVGGQFVRAYRRSEAWVEPGGIHAMALSEAFIEFASVAPSPDRNLLAQSSVSVVVSVSDEVTFGVSALPQGTPIYIDFNFSVDGHCPAFWTKPPGSPITPNASADAVGRWALNFLVPGGRPAGVPTSYLNQFAEQLQSFVTQGNSEVNQFAAFGYPKVITITMYGRSGVASTVEMLVRITTLATAEARYWPEAAGSVYAGVNCDLGHTVSWGGVAAVRQLDGTPVSLSDLSAVSTSGFDYKNAYVSTPEPSATLSMSLGAFALSWLARQRAARRRARVD